MATRFLVYLLFAALGAVVGLAIIGAPGCSMPYLVHAGGRAPIGSPVFERLVAEGADLRLLLEDCWLLGFSMTAHVDALALWRLVIVAACTLAGMGAGRVIARRIA